jgi:putative Holliday junction resolvase
LLGYLKDYISIESVERIIIGMPSNLDDTPTHATPLVKSFIKQLNKTFPAIPVVEVDERYSSKMASQAMIEMGMKKKQRQNKAMVDEIAATILLQEYLNKT